MRRLALVMLFLALDSPAPRAAQNEASLAGVYICEGLNPEGHPYTAVLEIAEYGQHIRARWTFPDGPPAFGVGLLRDQVLAISYFGPRSVGLIVYQVEDDKIVAGEWIVAGARGVYRESLTKVPDGHVPVPPNPTRTWPAPTTAAHSLFRSDTRAQPRLGAADSPRTTSARA